MGKIRKIQARQILDSRGNPTIEAEVETTDGHIGRASVPSGASTGSREALELRDGDKTKYLGKSVYRACKNINEIIAPAIKGEGLFDQAKIDQKMIELDGTEYKSELGANSILAVSLALARAGAGSMNMPLFQYIRHEIGAPISKKELENKGKYLMPRPLMNIINGGAHAANPLDIQEFMIVPRLESSFSENLRAGVEIFHYLKKHLQELGQMTNVGDEGGFAPNLRTNEEAIECILEAITKAGYRPGEDIMLSLDSAASEFATGATYKMQGKIYSSSEMVGYYKSLVNKYPIYSIEDGLAEDDYKGWQELTVELGDKVYLVGDDLFVTNKKIFAEGIADKMANSILIKLNQIGTLTETLETIRLAYENDYTCIISHRSGETGDTFISDLAVACGAGMIKTGSASRSDRMEKYNQLLRIEEALGEKAFYQAKEKL